MAHRSFGLLRIFRDQIHWKYLRYSQLFLILGIPLTGTALTHRKTTRLCFTRVIPIQCEVGTERLRLESPISKAFRL
jgi:hypothetical protein